MHLTALVQSPDHVCCRYRLAAFRPFLETAGHRLELRPLPRRAWEWFCLGRTLAGSDAVIVQRKLLRAWQRALVRRACRLLLFDFDDAVFLRDSYSPKGLASRTRRRRFCAMVRAADGVIAGNEFLRDQAIAAGCARDTLVIPTCLDPRHYTVADHSRQSSGCRLVWIGSASTMKGLEAVRPLLERVGATIPGASLTLVSDSSLRFDHLPVVFRPWSKETEAAALASADVGISWLPDDDWSRGKCGLKLLQYMAAGLPVVANPVGVQSTIVRHGETGLLAATEGEWLQAIELLAQDAGIRGRMGLAGRIRVEQEFSVSAGAGRWLSLLGRLDSVRQIA